MTMLEAETPTFLDLVARRWDTQAPVVAAAFSANSANVAFVGVDGKVWQTPTADPESSVRRFHVAADTGRPTISPRRKMPPPLSPVAIDDAVVCIAAFESDTLALGCRSGRVIGIAPRGRISAIAKESERIDALTSIENGQSLFTASAGNLKVYRANGAPTPTQILASCRCGRRSLAISPDAGSVAWFDEGRLRIRIDDQDCFDMALASLADVSESVLAWSPSGNWLAVAQGNQEIVLAQTVGGRVERTINLPNYPASVNDLSWSSDGRLLATSGAFRIIVWDVEALRTDPSAAPSTQPTGRSRSVTASTVAFHPHRPIIAAGFDNGLIAIAQANRPDELILREPGAGKATVLRWSSNGAFLALGTSEGEAIVAEFPPNFFK